jgi:hypothetical protein
MILQNKFIRTFDGLKGKRSLIIKNSSLNNTNGQNQNIKESMSIRKQFEIIYTSREMNLLLIFSIFAVSLIKKLTL